MRTAAAAVQQAIQPAEEKVVWGACSVNCGSRCALQLHVKDDEVVWVESDTTGDDLYGQHGFVPVCVGVQSADGSIIRIA